MPIFKKQNKTKQNRKKNKTENPAENRKKYKKNNNKKKTDFTQWARLRIQLCLYSSSVPPPLFFFFFFFWNIIFLNIREFALGMQMPNTNEK